MKHDIRFLLIVTALLLMTGAGVAQKFVHPGIDMNQADLEYMRKQVLAGEQPWKDSELKKDVIDSSYETFLLLM